MKSAKKNILLFVGGLGPGGTEKHFYYLLTLLSRAKFNIHLALMDKVFYTYVDGGPIHSHYGAAPNDVKYIILKGGYLEKSRVLGKHIIENNIDIIYSCSFECNLVVALIKMFTLFSQKVKWHVGLRGAELKNAKRNIIDRLIKLFLVDNFISNSKYLKNKPELVNIQKSRSAGIKVIPNIFIPQIENGYNKINVTIPENCIVIGCVSRLRTDKGVIFLAEAFAKFHSEQPNSFLLIVGGGEEESKIREILKVYKVEDWVLITGDVQNTSQYFSYMDIYVLPSLTESYPNALIEAMHAGVPVVASKVGDVPEIIENGINGLLVSPGNTQELFEQIEYLSDNKNIRISYGIAAKSKIDNTTNYKIVIKSYEKEFLSE